MYKYSILGAGKILNYNTKFTQSHIKYAPQAAKAIAE